MSLIELYKIVRGKCTLYAPKNLVNSTGFLFVFSPMLYLKFELFVLILVMLEIVQILKRLKFLCSPQDICSLPLFQICLLNTKYLWLKEPCGPLQNQKG